MRRLFYPVVAIHELPLHIDTKAFWTVDVFKKLKCYLKFIIKIMEVNELK